MNFFLLSSQNSLGEVVYTQSVVLPLQNHCCRKPPSDWLPSTWAMQCWWHIGNFRGWRCSCVNLDDLVNKQSQQELHQRLLYSEKLRVWCGISQLEIIGAYFFEDERESRRHLTRLQEFLVPQLEENEIDADRFWFQQDGATDNTKSTSMVCDLCSLQTSSPVTFIFGPTLSLRPRIKGID